MGIGFQKSVYLRARNIWNAVNAGVLLTRIIFRYTRSFAPDAVRICGGMTDGGGPFNASEEGL